MKVSKELRDDKGGLLEYFRARGEEYLEEITKQYGASEYKERAAKSNKAMIEARENLITILRHKAEEEKWESKDLLENILMIYYTNYIVMLECRNKVWQYDYMTFSRRIGEIWEPFCKLPFYYPTNKISLFVPPTFRDVKKKLSNEIERYINGLYLSTKQKKELLQYYNKVWTLVTSGEIKLELDLHFVYQNKKYVADLKSGFNSNEKGNTNRLLLVAAIYRNLEDNYQTMMFVRSKEDENNHYLKTLEKSGIWQVFCGEDVYSKINDYTGYNLKSWINKNINWEEDITKDFYDYLKTNKLINYLKW